MDQLVNIEVNESYRRWYESYRSSFMYIGTEFGYAPEEILSFVNQFFLDLLEKGIQPSTIENPKAYLNTAFRRKLIDQHRRNQKRLQVLASYRRMTQFEKSVQERLVQIERDEELITTLKKAYEKLPNRCKTVIDLKFYRGLDNDQIAEHTGLSKRSIYNNLYEGIKLLRAELTQSSNRKNKENLLLLLPLLFALS